MTPREAFGIVVRALGTYFVGVGALNAPSGPGQSVGPLILGILVGLALFFRADQIVNLTYGTGNRSTEHKG